jgi:hypothetical protein
VEKCERALKGHGKVLNEQDFKKSKSKNKTKTKKIIKKINLNFLWT